MIRSHEVDNHLKTRYQIILKLMLYSLGFAKVLLILSDREIFTVDSVVNKQNDRVVSMSRDVSKIRNISSTKQPTSVMKPWSCGVQW